MEQANFPSQEAPEDDRLHTRLGWVALLLGLAWAASDLLAVVSWYYLYFQGRIGNAALWHGFVTLNEQRSITAPASVLLALCGYLAIRKGRLPRIFPLIVIGLYCVGIALTPELAPTLIFPNSFLLQGAVLAAGGAVFTLYGGKGFRVGGFVVGTLAALLFFLGRLPLPPGLYDYTWVTASSPYFVSFAGPAAPYLLATNTYYFLNVVATLILGTVPFALGLWAAKEYASRTAVDRMADLVLRLCGVTSGMVLAVLSCFVLVILFSLLSFVIGSPRLIPGSLGAPTISLILVAGLPVCVVQFVGGAFLLLASLSNGGSSTPAS